MPESSTTVLSLLNWETLQTYIIAIAPTFLYPDHPNFYWPYTCMDIGYGGNCIAIGGSRYTIMLVDCATRFRWIYRLKSLTHSHIIAALKLFHTDAGTIPETFYTDFDPKLINKTTADWIRKADSKIIASAHQDKNGLIECNWNIAVDMTHAFLTNAQMPCNFWFHAMQHTTRICNIFPCKVDGKLTTAFELAYGVKLDYHILF